MRATKYNHKEIEKKWQRVWLESDLFSPDIKNAKKPFYNLMMFPYPSAEGLHAGNMFAFTGSDVYGRFKRMQGYDVLEPIGLDGFGMHSENYALKVGKSPQEHARASQKHYYDQLLMIGNGFSWNNRLETYDPSYYKWTQWLLITLFKAGLCYQKEAEVNFCPSCKTVVADEQVINGKCERCKSEVEKKNLKQWFFRITDYAQRLLEGHKKIKWSQRVVTAQRNWIGKREGAEVIFKFANGQGGIGVFTTRPDTLYGATFMVLAPEYVEKNLMGGLSEEKVKEVKEYISRSVKKSRNGKEKENREKTGIDTGVSVLNPANKKKIPVYVADYILAEYGTGAVMGVPAHDARDYEFAKRYNLEIIEVIAGGNIEKGAFEGEGKIINSGNWSKKRYPEDYSWILSDIKEKGWGEAKINYHLRDWLISRQRYWGPPIPLIYCKVCAGKKEGYLCKENNLIHKDQTDWDYHGWWPVTQDNLPVVLPELSDWKPEGMGKGPLANHPEFFQTKCPHCGSDAVRETDVSDVFLDSSWYFLRYPSVGDTKEAFGKELTGKWLPVDLYFGGAEHSVLHLMYSRFITMVLFDLGLIEFEEPFPRFYAHGLMIKDGAKMSKSKGNVVNPDEYIEKYGADSLRLYLMFMGPMDGYPDFRDEGMEGMRRFTERVWELFQNFEKEKGFSTENQEAVKLLDTKMHQTIKKVTEDIEGFRYNTAISALMEYLNAIREFEESVDAESWKTYLKNLILMLAPFAPYLMEEIFQSRFSQKPEFGSIHRESWPKYDPKLVIEERITLPIQINGKLRSTIEVEKKESQDKDFVIKKARNDTKITKWLDKKTVKKEIFVPGKLVNFVV